MRRATSLGISLCIAVCTAGCSSPEKEGRLRETPPSSDAGATTESDQFVPPERVAIDFPVFVGVPMASDGLFTGDPGLPPGLEGVSVCLDRMRPHGGSWDDYEPVQGVCGTTDASGSVSLSVPPMSELVFLARKEGYRPALMLASTMSGDIGRATGALATFFPLFPDDVLTKQLPAADPALGHLIVAEITNQGAGNVFPAGAQFELTGEAMDAGSPRPYYAHGGLVDPNLTETTSGTMGSLSDYSFVNFTNLRDGDYRIRLTPPASPDAGRPNGCGPLVFNSGFPSAEDLVFRATVLRGMTAIVIVYCI